MGGNEVLNQPRFVPDPAHDEGLLKCEKAIMSAESHFVVLMIGWLCKMSKQAC